MNETNKEESLLLCANTSSYDAPESSGQFLTEQLIKSEPNDRKRRREDSESGENDDTKNVTIPQALNEPIINQNHGKTFFLKNTFKNVSRLTDDSRDIGEIEEHFGVPWRTYIYRKNNLFAVFVNCPKPLNAPDWSILLAHKLSVIGKNNMKKCLALKEPIEFGVQPMRRCHGTNFMDWDELENNYLDGDKITIEAHITILKMNGVYKNNLRCFDESVMDISDIVLVVNDEKFHVAKLLLASHSPHFKELFLGNNGESKQFEYTLTGIDADDFQNYLEVLYGEPAVDDYTMEGILSVADVYDTKMVTRKCEEFLMEKSKRSLKMRLLLSVKYRLENLKKSCMSHIRTTRDIRSVLPANLEDMDHNLMTELFEKLLAMK